MNSRIICFCFLFLTGLVSGCETDEPSIMAVNAVYPDRDITGFIPQRFAPGLICTDSLNERDMAFAPDGRELYFTRDSRIMVSRFDGARWSEPQPVAFGSPSVNELEPYITPDNERLFFISQRPSGDSDEDTTDYQLWKVTRDGEDWSGPTQVTDQGDFYPSAIGNDTLSLTSTDNDLFLLPLVEGQPGERIDLGDSINTEAAEYNSYIAPDGRFIIFTSHGWGLPARGGDLFISFRKDDGGWTRARNMGSGINSSSRDYCPSLSPDGKFLFFASRRGGSEDIYWVDAALIDTLRSTELNFHRTLYETALTSGLDSTLHEFITLRQSYSHLCRFDGGLLSEVADLLLAHEQTDMARHLLEYISREYYSDLTNLQRLKTAALSNDERMFRRAVEALKSEADQMRTQELAINLLGYNLLQASLKREASRIFEVNVELFPESSNVYDSYGEALLELGDTVASIQNYRRSLNLDSTNQNARTILTELGAL